MPRSKPTIHDVAKRAKVSVGTVSHVLSGQIPVSGERQDRVKRAIAQLGYVPNFHAQGLRRGLSSVVGICFPHVSTAYLNVLAATLEDIALREGFGIMHVFSRHDPATEFSRVRDLLRYQVDGLILFPSSTPDATLDLAHDNATPLVLVDRPIPDRRFDQVILDNRKTIREAAKRLIALGHRRLLFVAGAVRADNNVRMDGQECPSYSKCGQAGLQEQSDSLRYGWMSDHPRGVAQFG